MSALQILGAIVAVMLLTAAVCIVRILREERP